MFLANKRCIGSEEFNTYSTEQRKGLPTTNAFSPQITNRIALRSLFNVDTLELVQTVHCKDLDCSSCQTLFRSLHWEDVPIVIIVIVVVVVVNEEEEVDGMGEVIKVVTTIVVEDFVEEVVAVEEVVVVDTEEEEGAGDDNRDDFVGDVDAVVAEEGVETRFLKSLGHHQRLRSALL